MNNSHLLTLLQQQQQQQQQQQHFINSLIQYQNPTTTLGYPPLNTPPPALLAPPFSVPLSQTPPALTSSEQTQPSTKKRGKSDKKKIPVNKIAINLRPECHAGQLELGDPIFLEPTAACYTLRSELVRYHQAENNGCFDVEIMVANRITKKERQVSCILYGPVYQSLYFKTLL